jgi:hypothetical protein
MPLNIIRPAKCVGFNWTPLSILGLGPKFYITCGSCQLTFPKRLPPVDRPGIECPKCKAINILPIIYRNAKWSLDPATRS